MEVETGNNHNMADEVVHEAEKVQPANRFEGRCEDEKYGHENERGRFSAREFS